MKKVLLRIFSCSFILFLYTQTHAAVTVTMLSSSSNGITTPFTIIDGQASTVVIGVQVHVTAALSTTSDIYFNTNLSSTSSLNNYFSSATIYEKSSSSYSSSTLNTYNTNVNSNTQYKANVNRTYPIGDYYYFLVLTAKFTTNIPPTSITFNATSSSFFNNSPSVTVAGSSTTYNLYGGMYWYGDNSTNWGTSGAWEVSNGSGGYQNANRTPGTNDIVYIGVAPYSNNTGDNPTLSTSITSVYQLVFGTNNSHTGKTPTLNLSVSAFTATNGVVCNASSNGSINMSSSTLTINGSSTMNSSSALTFTGISSSVLLGLGGTFTMGSATTLNISPTNTTGVIAVTNQGTLVVGSSGSTATLNLSGTGGVSTTATLTNTGTTTVGPTSTINITSNNGSLSNSSSGVFTFQSDATGSATLSNITGTSAVVSGKYDVQRFLTGGSLSSNRGYRVMGIPVNQSQATASTSNTLDFSYISGFTSSVTGLTYAGAYTGGTGGTNGGFSTTNSNPTIWLYDERKVPNSTSFTAGKYIGFTNLKTNSLSDGSSNLSIPVGNGYIMYFVGPSSRTSGSTTVTPTDATLTAQGYINQGNITVKLWYTPAGGSGNNLSYNAVPTILKPGYNMIGNPYPSSINLQTVVTDNSTAIDFIYLLSRGSTQTYSVYSNGGTSAPNLGFALSGEGFLVHAKSAGQTLTFKESEKSSTQLTGSNLLMGIPVKSQSLTGLYMKMEQDTLNYEYCGIYFSQDWSDKYEDGDAPYLDGPSTKVNMSSFTSDGQKMSINHMPDYSKGLKVKLFVNGTTDGTYKLKMEGVRNIDSLYDIYLLDHYKHDSVNIRQLGVYNFNIVRNDTLSYGSTRFELSIHKKSLPPYQLINFVAQSVTDGIKISWKANNEGNYTGFTLEKQQTGTSSQYNPIYNIQSDGRGSYYFIDKNPFTGINTYRLKQDDIDNKISYSNDVNVSFNINFSNNTISVYPNPTPATVNVNVQATSTTATTLNYKINIYDSAGMLMMRKSEIGNTWSENITHFKPGSYIIEVLDNDGKSIGKTKFVKVQ